MRQNPGMRRLLLTLVTAALAAGCPRPSGHTTPATATPGAKPGADLTASGDTPGAVTGKDDTTGDDHRLDDAAPKVHDLDVIHMDVVGKDAKGEPIIEAKTPGPLLDKGNDAFVAGKLKEAVGWYRKLAVEFPDSALAPAALYNIALVHEKEGALDDAVRAYLELATTYPDAAESLEGQLRAAAILADKEKWKEAIEVLDAVIARADLSREVRLEAYARKGYVQIELGALDEAEVTLGEAIATWRKASRIEDPYYIAMAHFYLGDIDARRFAKQPVRSADEELSADMRTKREHLMNAYGHWKEALQFKQAYWATASGYQMSQIFYEYWQAAVKAPFPDGMTVEARPAYTKEVHDRVRENLAKALDGHRANVELAEAYGVTTTWSEASKTRAAEILAVLDRDTR
jgi:tetratricopeptide (TPR) repeat protein